MIGTATEAGNRCRCCFCLSCCCCRSCSCCCCCLSTEAETVTTAGGMLSVPVVPSWAPGGPSIPLEGHCAEWLACDCCCCCSSCSCFVSFECPEDSFFSTSSSKEDLWLCSTAPWLFLPSNWALTDAGAAAGVAADIFAAAADEVCAAGAVGASVATAERVFCADGAPASAPPSCAAVAAAAGLLLMLGPSCSAGEGVWGHVEGLISSAVAAAVAAVAAGGPASL